MRPNRLSKQSTINYHSSTSSIQRTSPVNFHTMLLLSVLETTYTGTSLPGYYPTKNTAKSVRGRMRPSGELLPEQLDKGLSLGKDMEKSLFLGGCN